MLFCTYNLDLDPMTLTYEYNLDILNKSEMTFVGQGFQKLRGQTWQTVRQMRPNVSPQLLTHSQYQRLISVNNHILNNAQMCVKVSRLVATEKSWELFKLGIHFTPPVLPQNTPCGFISCFSMVTMAIESVCFWSTWWQNHQQRTTYANSVDNHSQQTQQFK